MLPSCSGYETTSCNCSREVMSAKRENVLVYACLTFAHVW